MLELLDRLKGQAINIGRFTIYKLITIIYRF